ncbi:hypothetical protein TNIN_258121 [Trichonephila inaurata madagascariensis]|uniref:Uncharacterized protein n=1 Tax=Trichonephila inaurata madagascariensis TaxID=2747483 RepID=A0A8X6YE89_9ARAC|nr:hypothetical protein TNIN_258121 [Trichonephila inaurata madagascariensis]
MPFIKNQFKIQEIGLHIKLGIIALEFKIRLTLYLEGKKISRLLNDTSWLKRSPEWLKGTSSRILVRESKKIALQLPDLEYRKSNDIDFSMNVL